jgi:hypothetical protein
MRFCLLKIGTIFVLPVKTLRPVKVFLGDL